MFLTILLEDRDWKTELKEKQNQTMLCLQEMHLIYKDIHKLIVKEYKIIFHEMESESKQG